MTDKEILQSLDKLDMELPFDEIYVGDKYVDVHELITEIKEKLTWHYPSKGEYPKEGKEVFVAWTQEGSYDVVEFRYDLFGTKISEPYAWQYIVPPKEKV